jgi:hypothetical protein
MRNSEGISAARVKGFTSDNVPMFFDFYEFGLRKGNHSVRRIFSAGKTGIITVQHMNSKVFSMRGKKETASLTLAVLSPA